MLQTKVTIVELRFAVGTGVLTHIHDDHILHKTLLRYYSDNDSSGAVNAKAL